MDLNDNLTSERNEMRVGNRNMFGVKLQSLGVLFGRVLNAQRMNALKGLLRNGPHAFDILFVQVAWLALCESYASSSDDKINLWNRRSEIENTTR